MKFKRPAPVSLTFGKQTFSWGLDDMVIFWTHQAREFNRDAEGARRGQRILQAVTAVPVGGDIELSAEDHVALKQLCEKPSCGWCVVTIKHTARAPGPDGKEIERSQERRVSPPVASLLPLIDAVPPFPPGLVRN